MVVRSSYKTKSGKVVKYYECAHNYSSKNPTNIKARKRALFARGSFKSATNCPSYLKMILHNGEAHVSGVTNEHSHTESKLLQVPQECTNFIRAKLSQKVDSQHILKIARKLFPKYVITPKLISNIKLKSCLNEFEQNKNDKISTMLLEKKLSAVKIESIDPLRIFICSENMEKFKNFNPRSAKLCIDSTHCTTFYGYYLTTLLVIYSAHFLTLKIAQFAHDNFKNIQNKFK